LLGKLLRIGLIAGYILLSGCSKSSTSKPDSPQGFAVTAGDGQVVVTWNQVADVQYWLFLAEGTVISLNDYFNQPGARVITPAYSPQIVNGLLNGTSYAFLMNATQNGGPAGATTASLAATPRLAGGTWSTATGLTNSLPTGINFEGIAYGGGGIFVAVGQGGAIYTGYYSGVGQIIWGPQTSNFTFGDLHGVVWTGALFVAVGDGGYVDYSADGVTWFVVNAGTNNALRAVTTGNGYYIVVGDAGTIAVSTQLSTGTWTVQNPTAQNLVGASLLLPGYIFVLGANGTLLVSTDGVTWSTPPGLPAVAATLRAASWGTAAPTPLVAIVGDNGTLITSPDIVNYTLQAKPAGSSANLLSLWYGSRFVTVGTGGTILYSDDGINWTVPATVSPAIAQNLNGVTYGNGDYVTVGDGGANAQSN